MPSGLGSRSFPPAITLGCKTRGVRGGSFANEPKDVRSARRSQQPPAATAKDIGFRVARAL